MVVSEKLNSFREFISKTKKGEIDWSLLDENDAKIFYTVLSDPAANSIDAANAVKILDLIANASNGQFERREQLQLKIAKSLRKMIQEEATLLQCFLEKMLLNFGYSSDMMKMVVNELKNVPVYGIMSKLAEKKKENFLRAILVNCDSNLEVLLGSHFNDNSTIERVLFSTGEESLKFICYLSRTMREEDFFELLLKGLKLWSDPVIARGYVKREIMHYTKTCIAIFSHCKPKSILNWQMKIVEVLVQGLPNHFNSTDPRTVILAKFLSELFTQCMKKIAKPNHELSEELINVQDEMCSEVLQGALHKCEMTEEFPLKHSDLSDRMADVKIDGEKHLIQSDDDDSDDDLEPIETMDVPEKSKIRYLRDFLEKFPSMESHEEVKSSFLAVPSVIMNQLSLEHPKMGEEMIDLIFLWENQFEDASLDEARKRSLESIIVAKPEGNVQHLCRLFHRDHVQPYRKNIVFEVLTRASSKLSLSQLQSVTKNVFQLLLLNPGVINQQDVTVRIPFVVFLGRLLTISPDLMIEEQHVADFMRSLTSIRNVDSATEQAIKYSVGKVMNVIGDKRILRSPEVRESISETRDFLLAIEANR